MENGEQMVVERFFDEYSESGAYQTRYSRPNKWTLRTILKVAQPRDSVLDIGCGEGRYLLALLERGFENLTGIEVSTKMCKKLEEILQAKGKAHDVRLLNSDFLEVGEELSQVEVALCLFGVIGHVFPSSQRHRFLRVVHQCLKPGGYFIGSVPNGYRGFLFDQLRSAVSRLAGGGLDRGEVWYSRRFSGRDCRNRYRVYSPAEVRRVLLSHGFDQVELSSESLVSEVWDTRLGLDAFPFRPASLGYQILWVCRKPE